MTVAAWNVNGSQPIGARKVGRIARGIMALDADLIALSELSPDSVVEGLATRLKGLGADYRYVLLDQSAPQNLAVFYRADVTVGESLLVPGSDDGKPSLRKALAARVKAGAFDFLLVVVHFKAGHRGLDQEIRGRQAAAIAAFIGDRMRGKEKDVLVIGDYNMEPGEDAQNFGRLNPDGLLRFVSSEELKGKITHIKSCEPRNGSLLDGFAIAAEGTKEYVKGSLAVFPVDRALELDCETYVREVSDQLPLLARFRVTADDD